MNGFAEIIDDARQRLVSVPLPVRGKKDPQWDPFRSIAFVWDRLLGGTWPLLAAKDLKDMGDGFRAVFAYALHITVFNMEFVRSADLIVPQALPSWLSPVARDRMERELSFSMAEAVGTTSIVGRLQHGRSDSLRRSLEDADQSKNIDSPAFRAAVWQALVNSHGAAGAMAADMLTGALREYALHLAAGEWESAGILRQFIEVLPYAIPVIPHPDKPRTLIVLCGG